MARPASVRGHRVAGPGFEQERSFTKKLFELMSFGETGAKHGRSFENGLNPENAWNLALLFLLCSLRMD